MSWRATNAYVLRRSALLISRRPLLALLTTLLSASGLALLLSVALLWLRFAPALALLPANPEMTIFVTHGTGERELKVLKGRVESIAGVASVRTVSKDAALADVLRRTPPGLAQPELKRNPLPDVLVATLAIDAPGAVVEAAAASIRKLTSVSATHVDLDWHRELRSRLSVASRAGVVIALCSLFVVVGSIVVSVRIHVRASSNESRLLDLVGASRAFVRGPFLYVGGLLLGVAGAFALSGVWAGWMWLAPDLALPGSATHTADAPPFDTEAAGFFWISCCAAGALIAWASSSRQRPEKED